MSENQENIQTEEIISDVIIEKPKRKSYNLRECSVKCESIDVTDNDVSKKRRKSRASISNEDKRKKEEEKYQKETERKQKEQERLKKEAERKLKEQEKEVERKRKEQEKEDERKRKEQEKEDERKRKEEEKRLKEEERKKKFEEKRLKELEKEEEKKRREEEKRLKEIEKEEDRKRKEEEKRLKDLEKEEERKKKEEERIRKESERKKEELEKERKIEKQRAILADFFIKDSMSDVNMQEEPDKMDVAIEQIGIFRPLEIKKEMKISEFTRVKKSNFQKLPESSLSLEEILRNVSERRYKNLEDTWPEEQSDIQILSTYLRNNLYTKFLMFHENIRPAYCGTWRKTSTKITGKNPLEEDYQFFDYDGDSDADWECESGEDIAASEGEEEEDINQDQDDLDFVVPHGYLSEGEDRSDVDPDEVDEEGQKIKDDRQPTKGVERGIPETAEEKERLIEAKQRQFEAEVMNKVYRINPNCVGPYFQDKPETAHFKEILAPFTMICRSPDGYPITCNLQSDFSNTGETMVKTKFVPPEAIPFLIRLVHCSTLSQLKLCYEFRVFWEKHLTGKVPHVSFEDDLQGKDWDEFSIGKKRLIIKIREIAEKIDKRWQVKPSVLKEYQICCVEDKLDNPCLEKWEYISGVNKIGSIAKIQKKLKTQDNALMPITN